MSKYIDAERLNMEWQTLKPFGVTDTMIENLKWIVDRQPTIEVSEDCISRAWVQNKLTEYVKDYALNELDSWQNTIVEWIATDIEDAPSVVPKPKEGEWVKVDDSVQPICSKCGMSCSGIHRNADYSVVPTWKYCPNCGAKMKG